MEVWITVEMGGNSRRNMPKEKYDTAVEMSQWLIETAVKAGMSIDEAESKFSIKIVDEYLCE